jgi:hypothetical protein
MSYTFNDEKFKRLMSPLGMSRNKGLWTYYRNTPKFRRILAIYEGNAPRAAKFLNAALNGSTITFHGIHFRPMTILQQGLILQVFKQGTLNKYLKAIEILNSNL